MKDSRKTTAQLIAELAGLRGENTELREKVAGVDASAVERQLAVERVRSAALDMRCTQDLCSVVCVVADQMHALGIHSPSASIFFNDEAKDEFVGYHANPRNEFEEDQARSRRHKTVELGNWLVEFHSTAMADFRQYERSGPAGNIARLFRQVAASGKPHIAELDVDTGSLRQSAASDDVIRDRAGHWFVVNVPFRGGMIGYRERTHRPEHDETVAELAQGLELGFLRFLDFRKVEEQNRELTIQNALERVRARALGMQNGEDIGDVVWDLIEESRALGFPIFRVIIRLFIDEQPHDIWFANVLSERENKAVHRSGVGGGPPDGPGMDEARRRGDDWHVGDWETPDQERTWELGRLRERGLDPQESQRRVETIPDRIYAHRVFFKEGLVAYQAPRRLDDGVLSVLKRFTDVFAIAYTRHAELLKKEEQNRALESANAQLEQASLNKSQFLRRMSHDLRSPMNAIIGYSRLLQRRLADQIQERDARNLANIETSSGNLLNLINEILDLSRIEAGRIEIDVQPVDMRTLAHECADALESIVKEGVEFRRELADVGEIRTDPDRLRQVIMNLLGNATKFTKSGSITLSLRRDGDAVELSIADTGIGIPAADLPHIFDEFRQVERQGGEQSEGTGLGLTIAKKTVDLLGGEMTATSEVGVGTTFTVRLSESGR